ncbi:hypothetical protein EJ069_10340 [Mesorhizobium sp. M2A.F.Ca.ET.043.05.1.1]|uniref:hypothetical protein n=1 Tax=Mesorhizobium sp. M2A.F.Ca.ET.043.05.1.1 TaxID=2493671 RepID=UPI000F754B7F|nr:hypothetical protein [Mesorhizobium sp. M2A.F.Ca.ET.043.05.1.1]AZO15093.1 hypothetical protein EJ069_10340 [Mesorhizobium sp. M2A.F.Ca.ET.043.05.1.1]
MVIALGIALLFLVWAVPEFRDPTITGQQHQAAVATATPNAPASTAGDPPGYKDPCEVGQDDRNSDLCAQWKAADAAEQSAFWTMIGVIVGGLTLIAAGLAAWYAGRAAQYTRDGAEHAGRSVKTAEVATEVSRQIGEAQARAYISVTKAWLENNANALPKIILQVRNSGQSPAYDLTAVFRASSEQFDLDPPLTPLRVNSYVLADLFPAGADDRLAFGIHPNDIVDMTGKPTPDEKLQMVELILEYKTVFDRPRGQIDMDTAVRLLIPNVLTFTSNRPTRQSQPVTVMTNFTASWIREYRRTLGKGRVIKKTGQVHSDDV